MYEKIQKYQPLDIVAGSAGLIDLSAAAGVKFTWRPGCDCVIYGWGGMYTEVIAAGGFTSATPVASLGYDKAGSTAEVEKSTITPSAAEIAAGTAVGSEKLGTAFAPFKVTKGSNSENGDAVLFRVKTQGTGGTTTGELSPFVFVEFFPDLSGA